MLSQPLSEESCKLRNRNDLKKKNYVIDHDWICRWNVEVKHFMEMKALMGNSVKSKKEDKGGEKEDKVLLLPLRKILS